MTNALEALPAKWREAAEWYKTLQRTAPHGHGLCQAADELEAALADRCSVAREACVPSPPGAKSQICDAHNHAVRHGIPGTFPEQPAGEAVCGG